MGRKRIKYKESLEWIKPPSLWHRGTDILALVTDNEEITVVTMLVWPWGGSRCLGHLSPHPSSQQPSCIFLLNMSHVTHTNNRHWLLHLINQSNILQRTCMIMVLWWCGCMRGIINQVRIPKLHQRNSSAVILLCASSESSNSSDAEISICGWLSKARFCFKVKLSNDQRLNPNTERKSKSKFKSMCKTNQTV